MSFGGFGTILSQPAASGLKLNQVHETKLIPFPGSFFILKLEVQNLRLLVFVNTKEAERHQLFCANIITMEIFAPIIYKNEISSRKLAPRSINLNFKINLN